MDWSERRRRFRATLAGDRCVHPGSVFEPDFRTHRRGFGIRDRHVRGVRRLLHRPRRAGPDRADIIGVRGAGVAHLSRGQAAPAGRSDHGYGNALSVMRTVQELEIAGVAALTIEIPTSRLPSARRRAILPLEAGVGKMRAAVAAREDKDLVLFARTRRNSGNPGSRRRWRASGPTRRREWTGFSSRAGDARGAGGDRRLRRAAAGARQYGWGVERPRLPGEPAGADRATRAPAVHGGGAGRPRHAEGAPRRREAVRAATDCGS